MAKKCLICGSEGSQTVWREFGVDILRCRVCAHVFSAYAGEDNYAGYFGEEDLSEEDYFWWNEAHQAMYDDFCRRFIAGRSGRLLDAGCGLGYFVKKISAYSAWQVFGYEISQPAVNFARRKLGLPNVFCGRVEESGWPPKNFNIITLWDVIEHLANPGSMLTHLSFLLADDGFLFIHTPNIKIQLPKARLKKLFKGVKEGTHYLEAKDHLNIYSPGALTKILNQNGFKRVEFVHLKPIQSAAGSKSIFLKFIKNFWYYFSVIVFKASAEKINLDNLFVVAKK